MYTQTLYELSQEAERLLQLSRQQLQLLEKMPLSVPGDDAPQLALPWSQPNIAERHAMLNNELRKISRLEMVLAIVGTMKAGKSTTINAIVGTEVLPNRNRPMTALPTLIRHTPGQKEPVLHFSHVASFIGVFFFPILGLIGRLLVTVLWVRLPNNRDEGSES